MTPWLTLVVQCCTAGISTGDLTVAEAERIIDLWIERLA